MVALLSGCAGGDGSGGWAITIDTLPGGVVHVVNEPPAPGIEPRWVIEPELVIGSVDADGPDLFGQVKGIAPLPDGRIGVLESQAQELRVFAPDGRHLRTFGGRGGGPGELAGANGVLAGDDGLLRVNDPRNARLSLFHPDSGFVASRPLEVLSRGYYWDAAIDSAGRIYEPAQTRDGADTWNVVKVYDARGVWRDTIRLDRYVSRPPGELPGVYTSEMRSGGRLVRISMANVPFWPGAQRVLDARGFFWRKSGDVNDYRLVRTTFAGDTTLVLESRRTPLPVTSAERDSAIAAVREQFGAEQDWSQIPAEKPLVESAFLDDAGRLWVRVVASDTLRTFDVFERDGRYRGTAVTRLAIPPFWKPLVRGDRLYTVHTDELDVPYVVVARIREVER